MWGRECTPCCRFFRYFRSYSSRPLAVIATASSTSGSACVSELAQTFPDKVRIRGAFRSEEKAQVFRDRWAGDAEAVSGIDFRTPSTLRRAFEDAQMAMIVTPLDHANMDEDAKLSNNAIQAAVDAGVRYIVYVGSWTVKEPERLSILADRFKPTEDFLRSLPDTVSWTALRGGYFMQNFQMSVFPQVRAKMSLAGPPISMPAVDCRDIGRCAAALLACEGKGHEGRCYEMSGPEVITMEDVANMCSKVLGKEVLYTPVPVEKIPNMPPFLEQLLVYMVDSGASAVPLSTHVADLCGRARTLEEFVIENVEAMK